MSGQTVYIAAAAVLGLVWHGAFALIPATRQIVAESGWWNFTLRAWELAGLMVLASVATATLFQRPISRSRPLYQHAVLAIGLPFVGALFFAWGLVAFGVLMGRTPPQTRSLGQVVGLIVFLPINVLYATVFLSRVVIPLGVLSQAIMHRLAPGRMSPHEAA